jgi:hypothetical protein
MRPEGALVVAVKGLASFREAGRRLEMPHVGLSSRTRSRRRFPAVGDARADGRPSR